MTTTRRGIEKEAAVGTVIQTHPHSYNDDKSHEDRPPRWDRTRRAQLFEQYRDLQAQGFSLRQAAKALDVPRSTLQAWRAYQERLDEHPAVVAFLHRAPGLAFLHRLVLGRHLVCTAVGACGIRLVCLLLPLTGLERFVAASYGAQHQINCQREAGIVAYRPEESARLATDMPAQDITVAQDDTYTGGRCLVAVAPKSHSLLLEPAAPARDHDTWHALMPQALAGLHCRRIPSTSDAAPGLLAYVAHHLGAHHAPDVFHGQHELVKAVSGPLATTQRAAVKTATAAQERLAHVQGHLQGADNAPDNKRGAGRPPTAPTSLEPVTQTAPAATQALERISAQREPVAQSLRAMGHAYHFVDLARGVRRHGTLIAADIRAQMETIRTVAQQENLSQTCLARMEQAERGVPKMQATIEVVSGYVRQQIAQRGLPPPVSYAMPAHLIPSC